MGTPRLTVLYCKPSRPEPLLVTVQPHTSPISSLPSIIYSAVSFSQLLRLVQSFQLSLSPLILLSAFSSPDRIYTVCNFLACQFPIAISRPFYSVLIMSRVGQLQARVEDGQGDYEALPPNSTRFRIVETLIHLRFSILETQQGRQSLVEGGKAVIKGIDEKRKRNRRLVGHIYKGDLNDLPYWVHRFLQALRNYFPAVCIDPGCEGEAAAHRCDWGKPIPLPMLTFAPFHSFVSYRNPNLTYLMRELIDR